MLSVIFFSAFYVASAIKFDEVLNTLYSGGTYSYAVFPNRCVQTYGGENALLASAYSALIDNWEYFYEGFGPQKYFAAGSENLMYQVKGESKPFYRLNTLRVYDNSTATFTMEFVNTTSYDWSQSGYVKFSCDMNDEKQIKFQRRASSSTLLITMEEIATALSEGFNVRYVSEYAKCYIDGELGMGATGGSNLDSSFDLRFEVEDNFDSYAISWDR